jgi:hypothetical protein
MPTLSTTHEIDVEFSVYCEKCSAGLCNKTRVSGRKVYVEPCPECAKKEDKSKDQVDRLKARIKDLELKYDEFETVAQQHCQSPTYKRSPYLIQFHKTRRTKHDHRTTH